jgi:hypothetical protein
MDGRWPHGSRCKAAIGSAMSDIYHTMVRMLSCRTPGTASGREAQEGWQGNRQGPVMEHTPRSYKTLSGVFRGMSGTLVAQVMRGTVPRDGSTLPCEVICSSDNTVKLIVSLSHREGAPKPFVVKAWDWIGYDTGGAPRKVRGRLRILAINGHGEVVYNAIYPPERMPEM